LPLTGQARQSDLASSTSSGDSAKNKSGSLAHGSARPLTTPAGPAAPVGPADFTITVTGMLPPIAVTRTYSASAAERSSMTATGPGRNIGLIPSHLLVAAFRLC
jgi:hypothetical protein